MIKKIVLIFFVVFSINANSLDGVYSEWVKDSATQIKFWVEKSVDKRTSLKWLGSFPDTNSPEAIIEGELIVYLDDVVVERFKGQLYKQNYRGKNENTFIYLFGVRTRYLSEVFSKDEVADNLVKGYWNENEYIERGLFKDNNLKYLCDSVASCNTVATGWDVRVLNREPQKPTSLPQSELSEALLKGEIEKQKNGEQLGPMIALDSSRALPINNNVSATSNNTANQVGIVNRSNFNTWTDPSTGLTWAVTFNSDKQRKRIEGVQMSWRDALEKIKNMNLDGKNDWRIPVAAELEPLMKKELIIKGEITSRGEVLSARLDFTRFIWTNIKEVSMAPLRAGYGRVGPFPTGSDATYVYAVRGGDPTLLTDFRKTVEEVFSAEIAQALKEENERKKQEAKYAAEQKKFQQALNNKSPQAMYLAAGTYARNDEQYRAKEIYQKIISRFPKSNWAVKASDQLSGFRRAEERRSESSQSQQSTYYEGDRNASIKLTDWEDVGHTKGRWSVRCDGGNSDGRFLGFVGLDGNGYYHGDTVDKSLANAVRFMIKNCN